MTNNQRLEIEALLNSYDLPHRFIVRYAVAIANTVKSKMTAIDLKALVLAERYGAGEDIPEQELREAAHAAYFASISFFASAAAYAAWTAAANAANSAWTAAAYAANAANAANAASKPKKKPIDYKQMLLDMIHSEYTEFELLMMGCSNESISA